MQKEEILGKDRNRMKIELEDEVIAIPEAVFSF